MKPLSYFSLTLTCLLVLFLSGHLQAQNALDFDGSNDVVQTTYGGVFGTANRTFEAWINVTPGATSNMAILDYGLNAVGSRNTFLVNPNNQLAFISGGTNANISSSTNAVPTGQWVHVAFVLDNGTGYLFVSGSLVGFGNLSTVNTPSVNANMTIGQRVGGGSIPFEGGIDEVRIWDVARTPTEIQANMSTEYCSIPASLTAYYKFNQGTANGTNTGLTTLNDNSGNGNNGTLSGFSLSGTSSNWITGAMLTVAPLTGGIDTVSSCVPYVSLGNQTLNASGVYQDTAVVASGCDSIYTLDFTALSATASSLTATACDAYTAPSGQVITSSGTHFDTLANTAGCDSIITLNLTILNRSQATQNDTACNSYTSPSGTLYTNSATFQDTLINGAGCDSIITINLVMNYSDTSSVADSSCGPYLSSLGNTYTTSGTYSETTQTVNGCDSVITLNLTITNTDTSVAQSGSTLTANQSGVSYQWFNCDNQSVISGETAQSFTPTVNGSYSVIIQNGMCTDTSGCHMVVIVGMEEIEEQLITLYPNPTTGRVKIDLSRGYKPLEVRVLNAEGKVVKMIREVSTSQIQLDLGQAAGLYTVLVLGEETYRAFRVLKVE